MSSNRTPNFNLHEWVGSDFVQRAEMNENFGTLDTELKTTNDEIVRIEEKIDGRLADYHFNASGSLYVRPTGVLQEGEFSTISDAITSLPKHLERDVHIRIQGTGHNWFEPKIYVSGFYGAGALYIHFGGRTNTLSTWVHFARNAADIYWQEGCRINFIYNEAYACAMQLSTGLLASFDGFIFDAKMEDISQAIRVHRGYVLIKNSEIFAKNDCVRAEYGAKVDIQNCKGEAAAYGLLSQDSSIIAGFGTAPIGLTANTYERYGGQVRFAGTYSNEATTYPSGSTTTPTAPTITKTYNSVKGESWRPDGWRTDNDVRFSDWGYGNHRGLWFFNDDAIRADLAGKTVKSIRIYIVREAESGYNTAQIPAIGYHNHETTIVGGAMPDVFSASKSHNVSVGAGQAKWITLPLDFATKLQAGTARGIGLYDSTPSATEYMIFEAGATLEITYQ